MCVCVCALMIAAKQCGWWRAGCAHQALAPHPEEGQLQGRGVAGGQQASLSLSFSPSLSPSLSHTHAHAHTQCKQAPVVEILKSHLLKAPVATMQQRPPARALSTPIGLHQA